MSVDEWKDFFVKSGFQDSIASDYAHVFFNNRMRFELLSDLTKEYLKEMEITFIGDIMTILRYAKRYSQYQSKINENVEGNISETNINDQREFNKFEKIGVSMKKNYQEKIVEDESKYEIFDDGEVYFCDFCNDNFTEMDDLDSHVKTIHTVFKPRKIKNVPEKSNNSPILVKNDSLQMKQSLEDERKIEIFDEGEVYFCDICNDTFTEKEALDSHVKTVHTVFKPFKIKNVPERSNNSPIIVKNVSGFQLPDDGNSKSDNYKCITCDKSFLKYII